MNLKTLVLHISLLSIGTCLTLYSRDQHISPADNDFQDHGLQTISEKPIIDPRESQDVDFSFFNDPYLTEQYEKQPLTDLSKLGIDDTGNDAGAPIVDAAESRDVDFSFFNDPYAFEKFRDLPIKAKFGGFVQYSSWWDSRQVNAVADGYVCLFPLPKLFDVDCKDINARGDANGGFLETRLRGEFYGPKVLGAESYAYLESDFIGSGVVANRLRIRHALMKFTWPNGSEILLGQYWNPAFEVRCYPLTVSFGVGEPNAVFARNPQIRYRYAKDHKEFILAAVAQIDAVNTGPIGPSSTYLRDSRLPMLYARGAYDSERVYAGALVSFERLVPRLASNKGYRVNESINSAVALLFAKVIFGSLEIRQNLIFSQNANNLVLLGGYGVTSVNPATDERKYTNLNTLTYWMDINIKRKIEPGLFIGIAKNLGAHKDVIPCITSPSTGVQEATVYGLGVDIDTLVRIVPRVRWHILPVDFCAEIEVIRAAYGCLNEKAQVKNTDPTTNIRLLFTTYYYF